MSRFDTFFANDSRVNSLPESTRCQIKDILRHAFNAGLEAAPFSAKAHKRETEKANGRQSTDE